MRTRHPASRRRRNRGLSIAEVMVSMTITSMLLVGVSAAYSASANAVDGNDRFFRATQAARVTMTQLLTEVRRADSVLTAPTNDSIIITREQSLRVPEEQSREFKYDAANKRITVQIFYKKADGTTYASPLYSMCRNVPEAKFGPPDKLSGVEVRVPVTVVVASGGNEVRLSDTSGPRRAF